MILPLQEFPGIANDKFWRHCRVWAYGSTHHSRPGFESQHLQNFQGKFGVVVFIDSTLLSEGVDSAKVNKIYQNYAVMTHGML